MVELGSGMREKLLRLHGLFDIDAGLEIEVGHCDELLEEIGLFDGKIRLIEDIAAFYVFEAAYTDV